MKKDYLIEKNLNKLADSVTPPPQLLDEARRELYAHPEAKRRGVKSVWRAVAACAAVVVIAVVSVLVYQSLGNERSAPPAKQDPADAPAVAQYKISELNSRFPQEDDLDIIPVIDLGENSALVSKVYTDKTTGETLVTVTKAKSVTDFGMNELLIVADLGGGLRDYSSYKTYSKYFQKDDIRVVFAQRYDNGEWYTYAYYKKDGIDYYVSIMSPEQNAGEYYFNILL